MPSIPEAADPPGHMSTRRNPESREDRIAALGYDYAAQPKQVRSRCNLCGFDRFVTLTHSDRYGYPARADGCLRCGLVFLNPVMTPDAYSQFYRNVYRPLVSAYHGRLIDARTIQAEQRDYASARAEQLAPRLEKWSGKSLLDVGGSTGVVAHHLKERFGLAATVLDPAPLEIEVAQRLGLQTVTGFVEDYDSGGTTYDLILLCQAVDHLLDVSLSLRKIRELLSPDGLFFVDIVDFPRRLPPDRIRRRRDQDRPSLLPDGRDDAGPPATQRIRRSRHRLRRRPPARRLHLLRRARASRTS